MKTVKQLGIFVASPSDVSEEREMVRNAIRDYNSIVGVNQGVHCRFIGWEDNVHSSMGNDGQDVINSQVGDDYDIFLCILWTKLGSPTPRALSGTVEEYDRALARYKKDPSNVHIGFYLKTDPIAPEEIDPDQLKLKNDFVAKVRSDGCLTINVSSDDFEKRIMKEITSIVTNLLISEKEQKPASAPDEKVIATDPPEENTHESEGLFILDLRDSFETALDRVNEASTEIREELETLSEAMITATEEAEAYGNSNDQSARKLKEIVSKVARQLNEYSSKLDANTPKIDQNVSLASDAMTGIQMLILDEDGIESKEFIENQTSARDLAVSMLDARTELSAFYLVIDSLPNLTITLKKAKRNAMRSTAKLSEALSDGANRMSIGAVTPSSVSTTTS